MNHIQCVPVSVALRGRDFVGIKTSYPPNGGFQDQPPWYNAAQYKVLHKAKAVIKAELLRERNNGQHRAKYYKGIPAGRF